MGYNELRMYAEIYNDTLDFRKAAGSKIRSGTVLDDAARLTDVMGVFDQVEHAMSMSMRREMRRSVTPSVRAWQKAEAGIGEHLFARLIGVLGDPYIATPYRWEGSGTNRVLVADPRFVRTVAQLWSYCGHGDAERRLHKGATAEE